MAAWEEDDVSRIIQGRHVENCPPSTESTDFHPVVKRTVTYIVCAVLFNDKDEVLMMQEAKASCRGLWYLPAGRMEPDETIIEGVCREVQEETGLEVKITAMLCVEAIDLYWFRFTCTGHVTGGNIKTPADADTESIQAQWLPAKEIRSNNLHLPIRAPDILPLIELGIKHRQAGPERCRIMPLNVAHSGISIRLVLTKTPNKVLLTTDGKLPFRVRTKSDRSITQLINEEIVGKILQFPISTSPNPITTLSEINMPLSICGVLSVEHYGKPERENDGVCITVLAKINETVIPVLQNSHQWVELSQNTVETLEKLRKPYHCIQLNHLM